VHENGDVTVHVISCTDDTKSSDSLANCIYIPAGKTILIVPIIYFSHDSTALVGLGLSCEVSRQNSHTKHTRSESSGRVIGLSQRPLCDKTHQFQETHPCPLRDSNPQTQQAFGLTATGIFPQICTCCRIELSWLNRDASDWRGK